MPNNLHKMPANFNSAVRGHPFKVFLRKEKNIYKCKIDKLSMVYSFFDDKEVKITGIDTEYTVKNDDHLILTIYCTNKGLTITSASLSIKSGNFESLPQEEDCFPGDGYYTSSISMPQCLKSRDIEIANFREETVNNEKILKVNQLVRKHITKYGPGTGYNQL
jgi:hypothetical protein